MLGPRLSSLLIAFCCVACSSASPTTVEVNGQTCQVRYSSGDGYTKQHAHITCPNHTVTFKALPIDTRHLEPCPEPTLLNIDLDHDGQHDLLWYSCGVASMWFAPDKTREAHWKEGRWSSEGSALPGLFILDAQTFEAPNRWYLPF